MESKYLKDHLRIDNKFAILLKQIRKKLTTEKIKN